VQGLRYPQLKAMARASLTAAFVPGASLWAAAPAPAAPGAQPALVDACTGGVTASPAPACAALLAASERARLQWQLEQQLAAFEAE
jgi:adenosine deaminase